MSVRSVGRSAGFPRGFKSVSFLILLTATAAYGQPAALRTRQFPRGTVNRVEDLPTSRFRRQLEQLPATARARSFEWLRDFHFTEIDLDTLHADADGGIFYVDPFTPEEATTTANSEP